MAKTYDDEVKNINSMYDNNLALTNEQLTADYMAADKKIGEEKLKAQQTTDANLNRTAVEAQKAEMNRAELYNAYGLSSGARAQARLASENQTRSDMATLREQLQDTEATLERERTSLSEQYASAIRQAQQENDLAKAQALYEAAQREDERINTQKLNDTNWERQQELNKIEADEKDLERKMKAALVIGEETGDYSLYAQLAGLTSAQVGDLTGTPYETKETKRFQNGIVDKATFNKFERGLDFNGKNYRDYDDYVSAKLEYWAEGYTGYLPTELEVLYLANYYGIK